MKIFVCVLLCCLVGVAFVQGGSFSERHESEVGTIMKFLQKIEERILAARNVDVSSLNKLKSTAQAALEEYQKAKAQVGASEAARVKKVRAEEKELLLIRKIKSVLLNDVGTATHPAMNCEEALKISGLNSGTFYIVKEGEPKKAFCSISSGLDRTVVMWHGWCNAHNRGGGWQSMCLSNTGFASDGLDRWLAREGVTWKVLKAGWYRTNAWAMSHNNGWTHSHMRISTNRYNFGSAHTIAHSWRSKSIDFTAPYKIGDSITFQMHPNGGNRYAWHANPPYNSMEVEYVGDKVKAYSGGCGSHGRATGWQQLCLNKQHYNTLGDVAAVRSNGFDIKKGGFYRLNVWAIQHGSETQRRARIMINGQIHRYSYDFAKGGWSDAVMRELVKLSPKDRITIEFQIDSGNRYTWHSFPHNNVELIYEGEDVPALIATCSKTSRAANKWTPYCLDAPEINTLGNDVKIDANSGKITVVRPGLYRVIAWATIKSDPRNWKHARLLVNGKNVAMTYTYEKGWVSHILDTTVNAAKGTTISAEFYTKAAGFCYPSGETHQSKFSLQYIGKLQIIA